MSIRGKFISNVTGLETEKKLAEKEKSKETVEKQAQLLTRREHFRELIPIASELGRLAHSKGLEPEIVVMRRDVLYRPQAIKRHSPIDRPRQIADAPQTKMAEGWLIARSRAVIDRPRLMELILQPSGVLTAYVSDQTPPKNPGVPNPATRTQVQSHYAEKIFTPSRLRTISGTEKILAVGLARLAGVIDERGATTLVEAPQNYFDLTAWDEYPAASKIGKSSALFFEDPEVIQTGLEEFAAEHSLELK